MGKGRASLQCRRILAGPVDIPIGCLGRHLELEKQWRVEARSPANPKWRLNTR